MLTKPLPGREAVPREAGRDAVRDEELGPCTLGGSDGLEEGTLLVETRGRRLAWYPLVGDVPCCSIRGGCDVCS